MVIVLGVVVFDWAFYWHLHEACLDSFLGVFGYDDGKAKERKKHSLPLSLIGGVLLQRIMAQGQARRL